MSRERQNIKPKTIITAGAQVFVLRRPDKTSERIFSLVLDAASLAGASVIRWEQLELEGAPSIFETVQSAIQLSSLVVADVTKANANLMFEIGMAKALKKPILLIASSSRDVPFDLAAARLVIYDPASPGEFIQRTARAIRDAVMNPEYFLFPPTAASKERKQNVFISYSHRDTDYLDRLLVHLKPLEKEELIDLWVDTRIRAGDKWRKEIERALARATVAILLVSADFLASDFIVDNELPPLLKSAEEKGTRILPLVVKPCRFTRDKNLRHFQSVNDPKRALALLPQGEQEVLYDRVAEEVERSLHR